MGETFEIDGYTFRYGRNPNYLIGEKLCRRCYIIHPPEWPENTCVHCRYRLRTVPANKYKYNPKGRLVLQNIKSTIAGKAYIKHAFKNSSTLKLVLPKELSSYLDGRSAIRNFFSGFLVVKVVAEKGEVRFYYNSKKRTNMVLNLGASSVFFRPGDAYFLYNLNNGILYVWQTDTNSETHETI